MCDYGSKGWQMTMTDDQINALFNKAVLALDEKQDELERQFGIGRHEEWKADLARSQIDFLDNGQKVVTAEIVIVGTLGDGVWLWGWANSKLPESVRSASEEMKSFASVTGLSIFAEPSWKGVDEQAWMLTALACSHFGGVGAYRMPSRKSNVYAVLRNVRAVDLEA
jgi:hypothetical protein